MKKAPMRTTYTGPVKNRGKNARGQANVSREELESFREQYGKDKTLRDLLNAELPGAKPLKRVDAAPAGPRRNPEAEAKRKADTIALLERMASRQPIESNEAARDRYKENTLNALTALGTVAGGPLASRLGAALARRGMKETPALTEEVVRQGRDIPFKKGGSTKSYAKGGSVRGGGCETRGKKTRYV